MREGAIVVFSICYPLFSGTRALGSLSFSGFGSLTWLLLSFFPLGFGSRGGSRGSLSSSFYVTRDSSIKLLVYNIYIYIL